MKAVSPTEFSNWLLTQFTNVDEIKGALNQVVIVPTTPKGWPGLPPLHYIVYDQSGKCIVIEPIKGKLRVYDNPLGVLTNSPTFKWHMSNLSNYVNLSPINPGPVNINNTTLETFSQSTGLHGLPGNFSSPARFIRASILSSLISPTQNASDTVLETFHLLNQFDIPVGAAGTVNKSNPEYTIATTVKDTKNLKYYFKTYDDQSIKVIDFSKLDTNAKTLKSIPMTGKTNITDITTSAN
jgi:choloylglycine hydrolase